MTSRLAERDHVVYRFYDTDGALLYVGMTCDFDNRRAQHLSKLWWDEVDESRTVTEQHHTKDCAQMAEAVAIAREQPRHNSPHWLPKGFLSTSQQETIAKAKEVRDAARAYYRQTVLRLLAEGASFAEVSKATGLSTNTLQRWKREAAES